MCAAKAGVAAGIAITQTGMIARLSRRRSSPASSSGVGDDRDGNRTQRERASTTAWGVASIFPGGFTLVVCELTHT